MMQMNKINTFCFVKKGAGRRASAHFLICLWRLMFMCWWVKVDFLFFNVFETVSTKFIVYARRHYDLYI